MDVQDDKARVLQTILFVSGINTLIQTTIGSRLPVVMGISFAYIVPIISVINNGSLQTIADPHIVRMTNLHQCASSLYKIWSWMHVLC
jgi:xanthine/uracil permease